MKDAFKFFWLKSFTLIPKLNPSHIPSDTLINDWLTREIYESGSVSSKGNERINACFIAASPNVSEILYSFLIWNFHSSFSSWLVLESFLVILAAFLQLPWWVYSLQKLSQPFSCHFLWADWQNLIPLHIHFITQHVTYNWICSVWTYLCKMELLDNGRKGDTSGRVSALLLMDLQIHGRDEAYHCQFPKSDPLNHFLGQSVAFCRCHSSKTFGRHHQNDHALCSFLWMLYLLWNHQLLGPQKCHFLKI